MFLPAQKNEFRLLCLALTFGGICAVSISVQRNEASALHAIALLSVLSFSTHAWLNRVAPNRDILFLPTMTLLVGWGLIVIARVAPNFLFRQLGSLLIAYVAFALITSNRNRLRWLKRFKYTWLLFSFGLLTATLAFGVNPSGFGARLWLQFGNFFLQPSEMLRLLLIAFWAAFFSERFTLESHSTLSSSFIADIAPSIVMWLVAVSLLATQQDFGAASLLLLTFAFMLYLATGSKRAPLVLLFAFVSAGVLGYFASDRVATRVQIWLNPFVDPQGRSFQVVQSLIAIASGGVFGQGVNQGSPDYVPAVHTDFPFVAISEEFGLIGSLAALCAYALICLRGWRIVERTRSPYVRLLAGGIAASLATQVFVIVGGNLALLPLTGVTLPFVSYGGSSLLVWFVSVGLLIRVSSDANETQEMIGWQTRFAHRRTAMICITLFCVLAGATLVTNVWRKSVLIARDDNPRRIDSERAISRGAIFDRDGQTLATSKLVQVTPSLVYSRSYPLPSAATAIGYYSERYGVGGLEEKFDTTLRGNRNLLDELLHRPQIGLPITTAIDIKVQQRLARTMTGQKGAAVLLDLQTGEVLAMASSPTFDPISLEHNWDELKKDTDAPLLNRVTQGLYQPGPLIQHIHSSSSLLPPNDPYNLGAPVSFELKNEFVPYPVAATYSETIGQGQLRLTPLRVATAFAEISTGERITPTLMLSEQVVQNKRFKPIAPITVFAKSSEKEFIGWRVQTFENYLLVIALEQTNHSTHKLDEITSTLVPN